MGFGPLSIEHGRAINWQSSHSTLQYNTLYTSIRVCVLANNSIPNIWSKKLSSRLTTSQRWYLSCTIAKRCTSSIKTLPVPLRYNRHHYKTDTITTRHTPFQSQHHYKTSSTITKSTLLQRNSITTQQKTLQSQQPCYGITNTITQQVLFRETYVSHIICQQL